MAYLVGTAGHVDHGKTTLIAALTGIDADRLPEEKARGMTIDIGFAFIDLEDIGRVSIVDVPGHERFVKNMLAGASGVNVALLCVAGDEGVMPQTREHFEILNLLEASAMVVAVTKVDLCDEEMIKLAILDVEELLSGTRYEGSQIVRVSAVKGIGLDEVKKALANAIGSLETVRIDEKTWFLPIDRVFSVPGHGTVITGTLARGRVAVGAEAEIMPGRERVRIRAIQTHGEPAEMAEMGQRAALNVAGVRREALHRGQAIGSPGSLVETRCINVRLAAVRDVKHGQRVRVHIGAGEFIGKLLLFDNAPGYGQIRFESDIACAKGQRAVLRMYSPPRVIAGAEIVTPNARPRRKGDKEVGALLMEGERAHEGIEERVLQEVKRVPGGATTGQVCEALGRTPQELGDVFERLKTEGRLLGFAGRWVSREGYQRVAEQVLGALKRAHEEEPHLASVPKSKVFGLCMLGWEAKQFDRLVGKMEEDGLIAVQGAGLRHPEFRVVLTERQERLLARVLDSMKKYGASAPSAQEIAAEVGAPTAAIEEIRRLGVATGEIVKVGDDLYYAPETLEEIRAKLPSPGSRFTVAQFRDATGSSRRFALPLLQYFDERRITRRVGDERVVL